MATTTNLGKVHVFPSEESYNTNKGSVGANDLALVPIGTASLSEYGLVRLASEADVLSEGEGAVVHVPLAYELNDFRRMNTAYNVGDKVNCAFRFEFYLECTQAGTTDAETLDTRNVTHNQVISDGTCQWTVRAHVKSVNNVVPDANGNIEVPQPDISGKINVSGARGKLIGYETMHVTSGASANIGYLTPDYIVHDANGQTSLTVNLDGGGLSNVGLGAVKILFIYNASAVTSLSFNTINGITQTDLLRGAPELSGKGIIRIVIQFHDITATMNIEQWG